MGVRESERLAIPAKTSVLLEFVKESVLLAVAKTSVLLARNTLMPFVQQPSATPSPADSLGSFSRDSLREPANGASLIPRATMASWRFASARATKPARATRETGM